MKVLIFLLIILIILGSAYLIIRNIIKKAQPQTVPPSTQPAPVSTQGQHTTNSHTPAPKKKWGFWSWFGCIAGIILLTLAIITTYAVGSRLIDWAKGSTKTEKPTLQEEINNRTLMFDGTTPCNPTFDYKFQIEVGGPVRLLFPGVPDPIYFDGKSFPHFPDRLSGAVQITSADAGHPNTWVKIYRVNI